MSSLLPIVPHECCTLVPSELEFAEQVAVRLLREQPSLRTKPLFQDLVPSEITDAPSLHIDDLKELQNVNPSCVFYQERARLRAMDGDMLATTLPQVEGYESYCRERLGIGAVEWITPASLSNPLSLAEACWEDRAVRRNIVHQVRQNRLKYVHPHMGSEAPWELALLLTQASHRPVEVIAPPPAISRFANDKGSFAKLVHTMFGIEATPASAVVWNTATAAKSLQELHPSTRFVAIKLPSSAGGLGNLVIPMSEINGRTLREVDDLLQERLLNLEYESGNELLATIWVDDLLASPSAQLWLPPLTKGPPILEGLFMQVIEPETGRFTGFGPAELPPKLHEQITRRCLMLAHVFQHLGYIGRCSFDMMLVGPNIQESEMELIECNGRWGGTSLPMTLMNRMFSDWQTQPFTSHTLTIEGVNQVSFRELQRALIDQLYCHRAAKPGACVLFNPQRTLDCDEVSVIALHKRWAASSDAIAILNERIREVVANHREAV